MSFYSFNDYSIFAKDNPWIWEDDLLSGRTAVGAKDEDIKITEDLLCLKLNKLTHNLLSSFGFIPFLWHSGDFFNLPPDVDRIHTSFGYDENSDINKRRSSDSIATLHNITTVTLWARECCNIPHSYIVIWDDEGDELGCLDMDSQDSTVKVWDYFQRCFSYKANDSFLDLIFEDYIIFYFESLLDPTKCYSHKVGRYRIMKWNELLRTKLRETFRMVKNKLIDKYSEIRLPDWCD